MNIIIYPKGSNSVKYFLKGAVKKGKHFSNDTGGSVVVNLSVFDYLWTDDVLNLVDGEWDKAVDEVTESADIAEINKPSETEYRQAIKIRKEIADLTYSQVENYIENNVTNLAEAKEYLKKLSKVVLGIIKMMDK